MLMLRKKIQKSYDLKSARKKLSKALLVSFCNRKEEAVTGKDVKKKFENCFEISRTIQQHSIFGETVTTGY